MTAMPFTCTLCARGFATKGLLRSHMTRSHRLELRHLTPIDRTTADNNIQTSPTPDNDDQQNVSGEDDAYKLYDRTEGPVCYSVFNVYDSFGDKTVPLYRTEPHYTHH